MTALILIFITWTLIGTANWTIKTFGEVTYSQIMFHLYQPQFFEPRLVESWAKNAPMTAAIIVVVLYIFYRLLKFKRPNWAPIVKKIAFVASWLFFAAGIGFVLWRLNLGVIIEYAFKKHEIKYSAFYETNYVSPTDVEIRFPEDKRNLIVIFAESMETGFINPYYFGDNLMPRLSALAQNNYNFSDTEGIGGGFQFDGINFTQGGMLGQFCGLPLKVPMLDRQDAFNPEGGLFDKALCLTDILSANGYEQSFMIGTPSKFSDTDGFIESHGRIRLLDQPRLTGEEKSNLKKHIKDADLFRFAKVEIERLAATDRPFAFTIMTMDTHFGTDTFDERVCKMKYPEEDRIKNVISCGDSQIADFVEWIKSQPFAEKTEVVVLADHLMMKGNVWKKGDDRRVLNIFINPVQIPQSERLKNRRFCALDIFPTLVESLGAEIEGSRLGLGVSLFSGKPTLIEQGYSPRKLGKKLSAPSRLYNYFLLGQKTE